MGKRWNTASGEEIIRTEPGASVLADLASLEIDKQPGEPIPDNQPVNLTEDQKELLQLFDALPESEQKALLSEMRARVENFNKNFLKNYSKARKRSANK